MAKYPAQILTDQEFISLLRSFPPSITGCRNRALVAMLLFAQLRCSEALDLKREDVNLEGNQVLIRNGKGGRRRVAGFPANQRHYLETWISCKPESEWFFCTHKGGRIGSSYVRKMITRHGRKAGIQKRVHPHQMRHQGACLLARAGTEIRIISAQLGHSNIATTDRYLRHLEPADVINGVQTAFQTVQLNGT